MVKEMLLTVTKIWMSVWVEDIDWRYLRRVFDNIATILLSLLSKFWFGVSLLFSVLENLSGLELYRGPS
jgi:hypothetical protein